MYLRFPYLRFQSPRPYTWGMVTKVGGEETHSADCEPCYTFCLMEIQRESHRSIDVKSVVCVDSTRLHLDLITAALRSRCGHYIFALWFLSFFFLSSFFFFSSPNLSGHRLDVYHTSTHGVALVRI